MFSYLFIIIKKTKENSWVEQLSAEEPHLSFHKVPICFYSTVAESRCCYSPVNPPSECFPTGISHSSKPKQSNVLCRLDFGYCEPPIIKRQFCCFSAVFSVSNMVSYLLHSTLVFTGMKKYLNFKSEML